MNEVALKKNLVTSFAEVDNVILKTFFSELADYSVIPVDQSLKEARRKLRLKKVCRIVYDKNENNLDKFNSVFATTHNLHATLTIILNSDGSNTELFIGTKDEARNDGYSSIKTFENTMQGNFPGIQTEDLYIDDIKKLSDSINSPANSYVSGVVGVPSLKNDNRDNFVQGLEKIIDGMAGETYTAVILASPVSRQELDIMESAYHELYSTLSIMEQHQITISENESHALGKSISKGITETISNSIAKSQSVTDGTSDTVSHTNGKTRSDWDIKRGITQAASGAAAGAIAASVPGGLGAGAGGIMGGLIGFGAGMFGGSKSESNTVSNSTNHSNTSETTETNSSSTANSSTATNTATATKGQGKSYQYTIKNRRIKEILEIIDEQLKRIRDCKNYGMWKWGTYFISDNSLTVKMGADIYSGILKGEATGVEQSAVTLWDKNKNEQRYNKVIDYIVRLRHPILKMPEGYSFSTTLPTSLISTEEVAVAMNLPQKSLPGIPVFESVEFGRSVSSYKSSNSSKEMKIGAISYLGRESKNHTVKIDINSLTAHTFITGSTGAGKSNTIYYMLNNLWQNHRIPFLIIEPAKGEYKEIFGDIRGVSVYGTNPYLTPVLRINPFSFPENIHITEHIDRFIEILNAVWPMYAAMPAILKEAIEIAYEKMGWNLLTSQNIYGNVFPDFQDLMEHLPGIIEKSSYSDEVKGNYAGALLTRVRSLTNGYFKSIFQKEEIADNKLFDSPCIVDLSRIGSSETKALLMGILFQKLNEYRISSKEGINSELQHITVLEEAHNLLRRTSFEQNQEGNNLQGKSVEMISNSIAEMRTYGEGFIIADQAPGLLDQSVIRNTNTKIILRLPDYDDRQLTGKAASLNKEQIEELAKLKTGCAAVYQNDWQEAVLCQFEQFDSDLNRPFKHNKETIIEFDKREYYHAELLKILIDIYFSDKNIDEVAKGKNIDLIKISNYYPKIIQSIKNNDKSNRSLIENFRQLINLDRLLDNIEKNDNIDIWTESILNELFKNNINKSLDSESKEGLVQILFDSLALIKSEYKDLWEDKKNNIDHWRKYLC